MHLKVRYVERRSLESSLPYLTCPYRQPGQGTETESEVRDLRAELLKAEAAHFAKKKGIKPEDDVTDTAPAVKRQLEGASAGGDTEEEDTEAKRRRILEETRAIDADSEASDSDSSEEER